MAGQRCGYVRVSTVEQNAERQLDGIELDRVFTDRISGATRNRAALEDLRDFVRDGDTAAVHSLDPAGPPQDRLRSGVDGHLRLNDDFTLPVGDRGAEDSGMVRNGWVGLAMLHNLFAREHNAICDHLKSAYPATGLGNIKNAFEPWDSGRLDPDRHPLRGVDPELKKDPWTGDAAKAP